MKKQFSRLIMMLLALAMLVALAACGGDGGQPAPASTAPASDGGGGGDDVVYELSFNYFAPEVIQPGQAARKALNYIEEASNGRIKFRDYWDGTYVSYGESIQSTITDVVDICFIDAGNINESFFVNQIFTMPIESDIPSWHGQLNAIRRAIAEIPEFQQELFNIGGLMWLGMGCAGSGGIHFSGDVDVRLPDDMRGMNIDAPAATTELIKACGASPIGSPATEWYTSMERNVIDGLMHNFGPVWGFRLWEVISTHMFFAPEDEFDWWCPGIYTTACGYIMKKEKFDSLPADLQQIMLEGFNKIYGDEWADLEEPTSLIALDEAKERGNKFIFLEHDEVAVWRDRIATSNVAVLDRIAAQGWDAYKVYEQWNKIVQEEYDAEHR